MGNIENEVTRIIKSRHSVRVYEERPIPKEILEDIIDCARLAPSGVNAQGWFFVVAESEEMRGKLADLANYGRFIRKAGACVMVFCHRDTLCQVEDACAATENILIAATSHGIGGCWINSRHKAHARQVEALVGAPEGQELITMVALGYPAEEGRRPKKALEEVLRWESFAPPTQE